MRIAIQRSWPNLTFSAEKEFDARLCIAIERLGWEAILVTTSDEIIAAEPDMVIVTHEFCPKLTPYPTVGVIWSPVQYMTLEPERVRNMLSYDGYLVATEELRVFITGLLAKHGKDAPVSDFDFPPSALPLQGLARRAADKPRALFYAGVHWDGNRHGEIFKNLSPEVPMRIYGSEDKWADNPHYVGPLPFDGRSVVDAIHEAGIGLSLHGPGHLEEGIPSMRLFESAAAGALIISDRISFARRIFGDSILYVDTTQPPKTVAGEIERHISWANANPDRAEAMAIRSRAIFELRFALDTHMVAKLPAFLVEVRYAMGWAAPRNYAPVDVVIRIGSRPAGMVKRALECLAAQTHKNIHLILVSFKPVPGVDEVVQEFAGRFRSVKRVTVPNNGLRSTAWWAGINAGTSPFVANLDDDDYIAPNHIALAVNTLLKHPAAPLVYAGGIEVQEDDGHWFDQPNFRGDIGAEIPERRRLRFLEPFCREQLWKANYILSNSWLARRACFTPEILTDPRLEVAEDVAWYCSLAPQGDFIPIWSPTAFWNWRSSAKDNSMFQTELWRDVHPILERHMSATGYDLSFMLSPAA